jgi:hypothetical protein
MAPGSADPMQGAAGACQGRPGESLCDGATMLHCDSAGGSSSTMGCMSAALCQVGLASGACATCMPGTFSCAGAMLSECKSDGQYALKDTCASAALCKDSAGACTEMVCSPNAKTCSADGVLRTCNSDGSAFTAEQPCGAGLCDTANGRCNKCMPNTKACQLTEVATCSPDGQTVSTQACQPQGDCWTASCAAGACQSSAKPANDSNRCNGGTGYCDGRGGCVGCLSDSHCASDETCQTLTRTCEKKTCGNGRLDPGENCDFNHPYFTDPKAVDVCDHTKCKITDSIYKGCTEAGACWTGAPWACAATLQCTTPCTSNAACETTNSRTRGACLTLTYQGNRITGCLVSCSSDFDCPNGLHCMNLTGDTVRFCGGTNLP